MDHYIARRATVDDAGAIARIYNHYVVNSTATFDTEEKSVEERERWLSGRTEAHPVIVLVDDSGVVVAWGAISPYGGRPAWAPTVEVAVYVAPGMTGRGLGPLVLDRLVDAALDAGHHVLVSRIVSDNTASIAMATAAGFAHVGTLREVGRKFDRWLDVVIMQRILAEKE